MVSQFILDIDPKELTFEFNRDWETFRNSRVKKFLVCWLEMKLHEARCALEVVMPENLGKAQGRVTELKSLLVLLSKPSVVEDLKSTVEHLEKNYGK